MGRVLPILFNTDMVRAILEGRKTVTRRAVKRENIEDVLNSPARKDNQDMEDSKFIRCLIDSPYEPGDILYVRETWNEDILFEDERRYFFRADENDDMVDEIDWRPSIHMPKKAARIWLKVTDVRVERLQDITEEQAETEGGIDNRGFIHNAENEYNNIHSARDHFAQIWNSTIKKPDLDRYGWGVNPWVWAIEFERCEKPEN